MVLGNAYGIEEGIAVDRHVQRVINRLGVSSSNQPETIERELMNLVPQSLWTWFSNAMILHGRRVCTARNPKCNSCDLRSWCEYGNTSKIAP
jgi:endonuclease-3